MKTVEFSESIAACDLKVGRCRQLIEIMKVCEYCRSRSFLCHIFSRFCVLCFTRPIYQVSVYRTIGPLVYKTKMAALLGFIEESHEKLKQGPALYRTSLLYETKILLKLKPENTFKIIMLKTLSLEFIICIAVELSHKMSNFAIPT